jgi:hypothetical protein
MFLLMLGTVHLFTPATLLIPSAQICVTPHLRRPQVGVTQMAADHIPDQPKLKRCDCPLYDHAAIRSRSKCRTLCHNLLMFAGRSKPQLA